MKIVFFIPDLGAGGAQRVCLSAARWLQQGVHSILIVTHGNIPDFYEYPENVKRIHLESHVAHKSQGGLANNLRLIQALRGLLTHEKPDILISFMESANVIAILSAMCTGVPVIITEHANPHKRTVGKIWRALMRPTYPRAQKIVSVSHGLDKAFSWIPPTKRTVIYNALPYELPSAVTTPRKKQFIAMGRLVRQKGFDMLIESFARISANIPEWSLAIIGEGEERAALQKQIEHHHLTAKIFLSGSTPHPLPLLQAASIYVFSSRFEGFGNALIEAMAAGLPVISFDCPYGPSEIVRDGDNGILLPPENIESLSQAMLTLAQDDRKRIAMGDSAYRSAAAYAPSAIMPQWEKLLEDALSAH